MKYDITALKLSKIIKANMVKYIKLNKRSYEYVSTYNLN